MSLDPVNRARSTMNTVTLWEALRVPDWTEVSLSMKSLGSKSQGDRCWRGTPESLVAAEFS